MRYVAILLMLFLSFGLFAQDHYAYINLDVNAPLSNRSWNGNVSSRGVRVGYRGFINDKFSAGIDIGYGVYEQYIPTDTKVINNRTITTDYFNYIYSYSGVVSGQYNFPVGDRDKFFPYVGLGFGANNNDYEQFYNSYQDGQRSWGFLARPEAGILVKFGHRRSVGAMAAVHADYSTNQSSMFHYSNFSTVGFQIGLVWMD
jgi:hypothetical protein